MAYPAISASLPATRQRRTASYPPPRAIIGPGLRPPPAAGGVPGLAGAAGVAGAAAAVPRPAPCARGSCITMGGLGESARLAATARFTRATLVVYGTLML